MIENNTSMNHESEMIDQIRFNQRYRNIIGTVFFSYRTLKSTHRVVGKYLAAFRRHLLDKRVPWAWRTDVKEPDPLEVIEAKVPLKAKIDEILEYLETVIETEITNLYKLDLDVHYSKAEHLELINAAVIEAKAIYKGRGYTVADVEAALSALEVANNTFITEHVLIGLGEFVTPEKQALIDEFTTSLNDLIAYLETITKTDKEKEDLTEGLYAPTETYEATEAFITRANNLLAQNIINDTELANYRLKF